MFAALLCVLPPGAGATTDAASATTPAATAVNTIVELVNAGQFQAADASIEAALKQPDLPATTRKALEFQAVRMHRIHDDFSLTAADVQAQVREQLPSLTDAQFAQWDAHGLFEHMVIDGKRLYFRRAPSNLFRLSDEARAQRKGHAPLNNSGMSDRDLQMFTDYDRQIMRAAQTSGHSSVMPHRVKVTQTVTVHADAVPAGKTLRAWIPYPRDDPGQQEDIHLLTSQPATHRVAPKSALQRTVYLEKVAQAGKPTVFSITYEVTLYAQYHAVDAAKVVPAKITPALAPYLAERAPHVVFTEPLQVFSHQIVGNATNPYQIARKIFAAVDDIPWAGAREYSTIADLSSYTLRAGHGDCGEQTMLLITLMRMNGIPARWQSGWMFTREAGGDDIHDWAEIYLAPYGWIPVDVTYGRLNSNESSLKWFYLGGLDNFRIAFNDGFSQAFVPPKDSFRSDTVDSQRGEVEWDGGDLYYDKWSYHFDWDILPPGHPQQATASN